MPNSVNVDLARLEGKVDTLTQAITKLVLFEERQAVQQLAIGVLSAKLAFTSDKLDMWINRGVGVWAVFATFLAIWKVFF